MANKREMIKAKCLRTGSTAYFYRDDFEYTKGMDERLFGQVSLDNERGHYYIRSNLTEVKD